MSEPTKIAPNPYFTSTGAELREAAAGGDVAAQAEIDRRKANKAAKRAAASVAE